MSVPAALEAPRPRLAFELAGPPPDRMTPARGRVLDLLAARSPLSMAEITGAAQVGNSVVRGLLAAGTLGEVFLSAEPALPHPDPSRPGPELTAAQAEIAATLSRQVGDGGYRVALIDGVTGAARRKCISKPSPPPYVKADRWRSCYRRLP